MATSTMVHVRVDEKIKKEAAKTLESMGLSVSDAVRVFLMRVVADKSLPFAVKAPNAASKAAMAEAESILKVQRARFKNAGELIEDLEKKRRKQTRKTSSRI
jgi:DNA-damage-inducible protein J